MNIKESYAEQKLEKAKLVINDGDAPSKMNDFAKSQLIFSLNQQIDSVEQSITNITYKLRNLEKDTPSYKNLYFYLYAANYEKVWLLSRIDDLENN